MKCDCKIFANIRLKLYYQDYSYSQFSRKLFSPHLNVAEEKLKLKKLPTTDVYKLYDSSHKPLSRKSVGKTSLPSR